MEYTLESLGDGFEVAISADHRFGTDAFLLADFAAPKKRDICCDLCSGNGIVALLMLRNFSPAEVTALEIQREAYELSLISKERSKAENFHPMNLDLRGYQSVAQFDLITCNPPYKADGSGIKSENAAEALARHEIECTVSDVCETARQNLRYGGRLCVCNRPERLANCIYEMRRHGIEPKRLRTVHKDASSPAWLILLEGRMGGSEFMTVEKPLIVKAADGGYSEEMKRIYRLT